MAYDSQLGFDLGVTQIGPVIERVPDARWSREMISTRYVLCAALSGQACYRVAGDEPQEFTVRGGDVLFFVPGRHRSAVSVERDPWHFISVSFELALYSGQTQRQLAALPMLTRQAPPGVEQLFRELELTWVGKSEGFILRCRALLEQILWELIRFAGVSRTDAAHYQDIERVRLHIQTHYDRSFCVEELAQLANCSPSHFRMLFRQIVGMTALQYATLVRVGKARDLLLSGEMNVSEAAAQVGYRDIYYFSRQFKKVTGHAPSEYVR